MLAKRQFDILTAIEKNRGFDTQRQLAQDTGMSLGIVNKSLSELADAGYVSGKDITEGGLEALEPYRVKRAVFIR